MSFINTIEDDSDQVELIVRQRFEAKPGCNIVGFDQFDQAGAVTELSTQLSSNSSRIDGIIASLSDTDANVIALNSNLLTAIANTASNTVTNASLVSGLRTDVDSNSELISNLQANTVAIAADLASNSAQIMVVSNDLGDLVGNVSNIEFDLYDSNGIILSNVSNLNFDMYQANGKVSNLASNLSNIESNLAEAFRLYGDAISGNSAAETTLIAAGTGSAITIGAGGVLNVVGKIFGFAKQKANQALLDQTRDTIADVFGTTSNNWQNITSSNGYSLTNNSNIAQLQAQTQLMRTHTDTTSARQIKINGNSSNIVSLQANTSQLATAIDIHRSNIGSLNQSVITIETDINSLNSSLADNSARINAVSVDLASNASQITNLTSSLSDNSARLTSLEGTSLGGLFTSTITSQRANGQAVALYARDTNSPDRADNVEYNYVLNAPPPGSAQGGIDLFINSANRTSDGGPSTCTLRNGHGKLRLGYTLYDTVLESNVALYAGKILKYGTDGTYLGSPTNSTHGGNGARFVLWPGTANTAVPYGMGMESAHMWFSSAGGHKFYTGTNAKMTITGTGVGIDVVSPSHKLQVNGTSNFNDEMTWSLGTNVSHAGWSTNKDWYIRSGSSSGKVILQDTGGNCGVNNSSPSYKLDINGDTRVVGRALIQSTTTNDGIVCTGLGGGNSYYAHRNADPGLKLQRTSVFTGEDMEYTLVLFPAPGGTPRPNAIDLGSSSNYWRRTYTQAIYRNNEYSLSDDRIKTGETLVENATETLLKLKPQTYDKHSFEFDKFTAQEYSNVSSNNAVFSAHSNCWVDQTELIENTIDEREEFPWVRRRLTEQAQKETGLIAQDIYYDCPELRHLISLPSDATPAEDKPTGGDDPQQDPNYDEAGWGMESASVSYTQLIPLLIKSNQELHERIVALENALEIQQQHDAQIADLEASVASRDQQIDELRSTVITPQYSNYSTVITVL